MGVNQCDRKDCENIMCNRYSDVYGHICESCFGELINYAAVVGVGFNITDFMETSKKFSNIKASKAYFNEIFIRDNE